MKKGIISLCIIIYSSIAFSNQYINKLDSAAFHYKNQQYEQAIKEYEDIVKDSVESAALFYNLGNAYYKSKNIPMAIANYEKALKLSPNDEDILFNLKIAQTHTVDKINSIPVFFLTKWYQNFTSLFSSNTWSLISIFSFAICLILVFFFLYSQQYILRKTLFYLATFALLISISSSLGASQQKTIQYDQVHAIITNPSVGIKSSPDDSSTELFILHSGTKLLVLDQLKDWFKIKINNGSIGWIKKEDVTEV